MMKNALHTIGLASIVEYGNNTSAGSVRRLIEQLDECCPGHREPKLLLGQGLCRIGT
jgi:hypothetical protein